MSMSTDATHPASHALAVTPSDSVELGFETRGLYVGSTGDLAVEMAGGQIVTFAAVPVGSILPVRVSKVMATGTTATLIIALK